jgi:hypothetical protein
LPIIFPGPFPTRHFLIVPSALIINKTNPNNMVGQWVYQNHSPNSENELHFQNIPKPSLTSPTDILVRIRAVSLNYRDVSP